MIRGWVFAAGSAVLVGSVAFGFAKLKSLSGTTPTGKQITPLGEQTEVGSFPVNMTSSPDGKFLLVTNCGFRQQLSVLDSTTGQLVSRIEFNGGDRRSRQSLYFGIAAVKTQDGQTEVAVSRGSQDMVSLYTLDNTGHLNHTGDVDLPRAINPANIPHHVAGVAWSADGSRLYAVGNQSHAFNNFQGSLFTIDPAAKTVLAEAKVGPFPLGALVGPDGSVYVANEGGRAVSRLATGSQNSQDIVTGEAPRTSAPTTRAKTCSSPIPTAIRSASSTCQAPG